MIRAIHPFGPRPGQYRPAVETDISETIRREKKRLELDDFDPFKDREEIDAQDYLEGKR